MPREGRRDVALGVRVQQAAQIDRLARVNGIRQVPVQQGGKLVGGLTDRDIKLAASFRGPGELNVEDVMTPDPYVVAPEAALDAVVLEMAEHKYGCAIVVQPNGKVVGIFTANDACRVLGEILKSNYKEAVA